MGAQIREHRFGVISVALDIASVGANTSAEQTFTVKGLRTSDFVAVSKPAADAGLVVGNARVSAADTLAVTFGNLTGSGINPGSETYKVFWLRAEALDAGVIA